MQDSQKIGFDDGNYEDIDKEEIPKL